MSLNPLGSAVRLALLALAVLALGAPRPAAAQTCAGDVILTTPGEVAAFDCAHVGGTLGVTSLDAADPITDLSALAGLTAVSGNVFVQHTDLETLDGLGALTDIGGMLIVEDNAALVSLGGLDALRAVGSFLIVARNDALTVIDGLNALETVGSSLKIVENAALTEFGGFESLRAVGVSGVTYLNVSVYGNPRLRGITGLGALERVSGSVSVRDNAVLARIDGLGALAEIGAWLGVTENASLESVDGLSALRAVSGGVNVSGNASLNACACGLYALLADGIVGDTVFIADNAPGCNAPSEITEPEPGTCEQAVDAEDGPETALALTVGPNPAAGAVAVRFALATPSPARVTVYDVRGRLVATLLDADAAGETSAALDVSGWAPGVYVVRLDARDRAETVSFTVAR